MRLGVLGGTFDPIHIAHLRVAEEVREALGLDRMLLVPSADPPHKRHHAAPEHRLAMVRLATSGEPGFEAVDVELRRAGPSYTVDTLAELRGSRRGAELWFVMGTDQFRVLDSWSRPERLLELTNLAIVERPGEKEGTLAELVPAGLADRLEVDPQSGGNLLRDTSGHAVRAVPITAIDVSSSELRRRLALGHSVRYLVPDAVLDYIDAHGLYASGGATSQRDDAGPGSGRSRPSDEAEGD